ncbi:redoxin domain-containing protein [Planctomycetota bacterium]
MVRSLRTVSWVILLTLFSASPVLAQSDDARYRELFEEGLDQLRARDYDASIESFQRLIRMRPDQPRPYYNIACAYALQGMAPEAVEWLERAIERGFRELDHLDADQDLDLVRRDPAFREMLRRHFHPEPGGPALRTFRGEPASLDKLRGKVVVLFFWRTYSEPCRNAIPHLIRLQRDHGPRGLVVVGISNEEVETLEATADELKISYTLLRQVGSLPRPFGSVHIFPTLFVLDRGGRVAERLIGLKDRGDLDRVLEPLLRPGEQPPEKPRKPKAKEPQLF